MGAADSGDPSWVIGSTWTVAQWRGTAKTAARVLSLNEQNLDRCKHLL
jgi:hypothetical protein